MNSSLPHRAILILVLGVSGLLGCNLATPGPIQETPPVKATPVPATPARPTDKPTAGPAASATPDEWPTLEATTPMAPEVVTPLPGAAGGGGLGDSLYPGFGNGGYDVKHYTLELTVREVGTGDLEGVTTLEAEATQDLGRFNLDFIGFTVDAVTVEGQPAGFDRTGQELTVTPAEALATGQMFEVRVAYHGQPRVVESVAAPGQIGWILFDGGSYVLSEPDGAATFFPVNDHPLDKATYSFRVTVPSDLEVAANGVLADTVEQGTATTYVWEMRDPMASYLATVAIGDFDLVAAMAPNGIPLRDYFGAGAGKAYRRPFARQGEMLALYSRLFGPYPFAAYGSLVLDTEMGTALECQTLSIYGVDQLDLEDLPATEQLVAHELAHQWFGDSLSVADWGEIWLNEGFATYAEGLWIEQTEGAAALDAWVQAVYEEVVDGGDEIAPPGLPEADDLFNDGVYLRGGLTLHALRLEVGEAAFFEIMQAYVARFQGGNVETADFVAVAEEISGQDLADFFDEWLYGDTVPAIPELDLEP